MRCQICLRAYAADVTAKSEVASETLDKPVGGYACTKRCACRRKCSVRFGCHDRHYSKDRAVQVLFDYSSATRQTFWSLEAGTNILRLVAIGISFSVSEILRVDTGLIR
jgi:hypothetical protein